MKPLPAQHSAGTSSPAAGIPALPTTTAAPSAAPLPPAIALPPSTGPYSAHNRKISSCPVQRVYPWLLLASTTLAAVFCLLYINKPVIVGGPVPGSPNTGGKSALAMSRTPGTDSPVATDSLLPGSDRLPGDAPDSLRPTPSDPRRALPGSSSANPTEETNLRIQHILTAEAPGGHLDRIDLEVPVLYQSRNLRWSPEDVTQARELLVRLMDYQEKSGALRAEGADLLDAWNRLVQRSIPAAGLRADSPSLPTNQQDAADSARPASMITTESIQLEPPGK
jgi:hypothetical protein